jgi:hypothetical protein
MKKPKGPDLKMPELKVPAFANDLYQDLRDRRLLPLVGLVLVAIVAVPFLLSSGSEPKPGPASEGPVAAASNASSLTVVQATPGLRDYRKRLRGRTPTDPFRTSPAKGDLSAAKLGTKGDNGFESSEVTSTTSTTTTSDGTTVTKKTTQSPAGETTTKTTETEVEITGEEKGVDEGGGQQSEEINLYSFAIDAKITRTEEDPESHKKTTKTQQRVEILPPAPLPGEKEQAVTYMGISPKTKNPLLLISDSVTSVFGEGKCLSGESKCQLLEVETGIPTTLVLSEGRVRIKINILKVKPVIRGHY